MAKPVVLLIGGLDPQGCAGIAADLATVEHHDCHGLPLVTAMTQQNSTGLSAFGAVDVSAFWSQYLDCVADFEINAIKIGLIPNLAIAEVIEQILRHHDVPVVMDPVLATSSGGEIIGEDVQLFIIDKLLSEINLLTPNLPELIKLSGVEADSETITKQLIDLGLPACLAKGGHTDSQFASDYFVSEQTSFYLYQDRMNTPNVRGTGCVLASAIAAQLACGQDIRDALVLAKAYINRGIRLSTPVGPYHVFEHKKDPLAFEDIPKLCYDKNLIGQRFEFSGCPKELGIYPVVDSSDWIKKLADLNVTTLQLRVKGFSEQQTEQEIKTAIDLIDDKKTCLFINDHWSLAIKYQAYGVHLGQEDLYDANLKSIAEAGLRLGLSTHSYWELARALAVNPSYIALGPIYATTSKQMPFSPQGVERLQEWVRLLEGQYPVVAIGGIDLERAKALKSTQVGSVAMISAITKADDYQKATLDLLQAWG